MSKAKSSSSHAPRSGSWGGTRTKLCVFAFLVTGAAVYLVAVGKVGRSSGYTATATIYHRFTPSDGRAADDPAAVLPRPDPTRIEQQIGCDANLRRALGRLAQADSGRAGNVSSAGPAESPAQLRRRLRVVTDETSSPGQLRTSISFADRNRDRAVRLVNHLARQYAEQSRTAVDGTFNRRYLEARSAADLARRAFREAKGQLEAFLAGHFQEAPAETEPETGGPSATPPSAAGRAAPAPTAARPSRMVDNPEWVELDRQLAELEGQRSQLLVERMPVHPEVQDIDARIARLQQHLASVPMQIAEARAEDRNDSPRPAAEAAHPTPLAEDPSAMPALGDPAEKAHEQAEAARQFWAKKGACDRAEQTLDRLALLERRAWEEQRKVPQIDVQLAEAGENPESAVPASRLLLVALIAGLAVAAGVGMVSTGLAGDPPLATPAAAQAVLPVPIVGAITATGPAAADAAGPQSRHVGGLAMTVYGTVLIAICFGILLVVFW